MRIYVSNTNKENFKSYKAKSFKVKEKRVPASIEDFNIVDLKQERRELKPTSKRKLASELTELDYNKTIVAKEYPKGVLGIELPSGLIIGVPATGSDGSLLIADHRFTEEDLIVIKELGGSENVPKNWKPKTESTRLQK